MTAEKLSPKRPANGCLLAGRIFLLASLARWTSTRRCMFSAFWNGAHDDDANAKVLGFANLATCPQARQPVLSHHPAGQVTTFAPPTEYGRTDNA